MLLIVYLYLINQSKKSEYQVPGINYSIKTNFSWYPNSQIDNHAFIMNYILASGTSKYMHTYVLFV